MAEPMVPPVSAESRFTKITVASMAAVFVLNAIVFYTTKFSAFVHSDAAVTVLLGVKSLHAKLPVVGDWYYANGDVWVFAPHWWATLFLPFFGVSPKTLLAATLLGLALELGSLVWAFRRLSRSVWVSVLASVAMLFAWSKLHVLFVYVELSYGFSATFYVVLFVLYAELLSPVTPNEAALRTRLRACGAALLFFVIALQNPTRGLVFGLVPLLVGCAWPWRQCGRARRVWVASVAAGAWIGAFLIYRFGFKPMLAFSPHGGAELSLRDAAGVMKNLDLLFRGMVALMRGREDIALSAIAGFIVFGGALVWVVREIVRSRTLDPFRFVCVVILAQLGVVLVPLVFGNLLGDEASSRYLMPSLLPVLGLACVSAARALSSTASRRAQLATVWLGLVPISASVAASRRFASAPEVFSQADPAEQTRVANELVRRGLAHGFASYWNANALTVLSNGAAKTCGVGFGQGLVPLKWVVDTDCFDARKLPPRIYVVARIDEQEAATRALSATLPPPIERFVVERFEVTVFRTADCSLSWLELPLPNHP